MSLTEQQCNSIIQQSQEIWKNLYERISEFESELVQIGIHELSTEQKSKHSKALNSLKIIQSDLKKINPNEINDSSKIMDLDQRFSILISDAGEFIIRFRYENIYPYLINESNRLLLRGKNSNLLPSEEIWLSRIQDMMDKYSQNLNREHLDFLNNNLTDRFLEIEQKLELESAKYKEEFTDAYNKIKALNDSKLSVVVEKIKKKYDAAIKADDQQKMVSVITKIKKYLPDETQSNDDKYIKISIKRATELYEQLTKHKLIEKRDLDLLQDMNGISVFLNDLNENMYNDYITKFKTHDTEIPSSNFNIMTSVPTEHPKETFVEKALKPVKKIVYKIRIEDKLKKIKNLQPENPDQWLELYRKFYEAERLAEKENKMMDFQEKFNELEDEKNNQFAEYYLKNYPGWLKGTLNDAPMLSHQVFKSVKSKERSTYYLIIDGMRYDQWLYIKDDLSAQILKNYKLADFKDYYFSVIPTVTEIARKSLIGGKKFSDISKGNSDDYLLKSLFSAKTMMSSYNSDKSWRTFEIENLIEDKPDVLVIRIQNMDNVIHKLQETKNPINNGKLLDYFQAEMKHDIFHLISSLIELNSRIVITADHGCIVSRGEQKIDKNGIILRERYFIKSPEKIIKPENYFTISSGEIGMPEISHEYCFMKNPYISPKKNQISPNSVTHGGVSLNECVVPLAVFDPA